ncbi:MAG: transglutaminase family protein [Planctomycetota bacterium]|nr:transglutaminase family protein [Planctomycetota bacterium]
MFIHVGYDITFALPAPTPMHLMLYTHPSRSSDLMQPEWIATDPVVPITTFEDVFGNRVGRIVASAGNLRVYSSSVVRDSGAYDRYMPNARQMDVSELPTDTLQFLMGSRYCETDRLTDLAWSLFGGTQPGWSRVQAVAEWVHNHIRFGYQFARPTKTAYDVYCERQGVCRDFTHLTITLLRCLNIPARYTTGYLGDIGVPRDPAPMDFSAWVEVFLDGQWFTFDARHNVPRIGRIVMARGRDATDVAMTTSFGGAKLLSFTVITEEVSNPDVSFQSAGPVVAQAV